MRSKYMCKDVLRGLEKCPHCSVAKPHLVKVWSQNDLAYTYKHKDYYTTWVTARCTSCEDLVLAKSIDHHDYRNLNDLKNGEGYEVLKIFPTPQSIASALPETVEKYLKQALDTIHAPDGSVMLCASAIDAMLKDKGYEKGWLNDRIKKAAEDGLITHGMAEWAHAVRLEANNPRHADKSKPHMSREDADQAISFANSLGMVLYELPAKIEKGKAAAKRIENTEE